MATKSTKTTKSSAGKKPAATAKVDAESTPKEKITPKEIDIHQYITVFNGFQGKLVYVSKRTGEKFVWDSYGTSQEMELLELRNAKSSSKKFFEYNWFMFNEDDSWVVDYLGVGRFYKNAISIGEFDDIFTLPLDKLKSVLGDMSRGQLKSVHYRANQLIKSGEIDSRKVISVLEEALGVELVES